MLSGESRNTLSTLKLNEGEYKMLDNKLNHKNFVIRDNNMFDRYKQKWQIRPDTEYLTMLDEQVTKHNPQKKYIVAIPKNLATSTMDKAIRAFFGFQLNYDDYRYISVRGSNRLNALPVKFDLAYTEVEENGRVGDDTFGHYLLVIKGSVLNTLQNVFCPDRCIKQTWNQYNFHDLSASAGIYDYDLYMHWLKEFKKYMQEYTDFRIFDDAYTEKWVLQVSNNDPSALFDGDHSLPKSQANRLNQEQYNKLFQLAGWACEKLYETWEQVYGKEDFTTKERISEFFDNETKQLAIEEEWLEEDNKEQESA